MLHDALKCVKRPLDGTAAVLRRLAGVTMGPRRLGSWPIFAMT
jgi:hypothetical protein